MTPTVITTTADLTDLCNSYAQCDYVTVDTEFMRERTYWPILCLVQVGRPRFEDETDADWERHGAAIIDPLAKGIDLAPLYALMSDESVLKVFHAARQDVEIFVKQAGAVPKPLFDTQIAGMVCGFGDQVGYEKLVRGIVNVGLDKSSRFTDWAKRPLSEKQLDYALGDVTHLRQIYEFFADKLEQEGRAHWLTQEMDILEAIETYRVEPEDAWQRLKMRGPNARLFGAAQALAAWREETAQRKDVPRNRVLKDDALLEIAAARPKTADALTSGRMSRRESLSRDAIQELLDLVANAPSVTPPKPAREAFRPDARQSALSDLLRTLLRANASKANVAERLVASAADLDQIAMHDEPDVAAMQGWRRELFGDDALRLKRGEVALSAGPDGVVVIELGAQPA